MRKLKKYSDFVNEGIRDKMTPKSEEDIRRDVREKLRETLNVAKKEWEEREMEHPLDLGELANYHVLKHFGSTTIFKFEDTDEDDRIVNPYIKDEIDDWLLENFPKWSDMDDDGFWLGFKSDPYDV